MKDNTRFIPLNQSRTPYKNPKITIGEYRVKSNGDTWILLRHHTEIGSYKLLKNLIRHVLQDKTIDTEIKLAFRKLLPSINHYSLETNPTKKEVTNLKPITLGKLKLTVNKHAWILSQATKVDDCMGNEKYNTKYLDEAIRLAVEEEARNSRSHDLTKAYTKAIKTVMEALGKRLDILYAMSRVPSYIYRNVR